MITQASGKRRSIDGGARSDHKLLCRYSEMLDCPTPIQPVVQLQVLVNGWRLANGEQWPPASGGDGRDGD